MFNAHSPGKQQEPDDAEANKQDCRTDEDRQEDIPVKGVVQEENQQDRANNDPPDNPAKCATANQIPWLDPTHRLASLPQPTAAQL